MSADNGSSVLRPMAGDLSAIPETSPGLLPVCNYKGILLDRHVWSENGKVCLRCRAER